MKLPFTITEGMTHDRAPSRNTARKKWRDSHPAQNRYHSVPTTFIGVDGEGVTLPDGSHRYVLLGVGDQQIENPEGLSWEEVCGFLWSQFKTGSVAYTGFFLGYDFVQWIKSLPENRARILLTSAGRAARAPKSGKRVMPFPVRYGPWEFDILGTKRFKLRKAGSARWMSICDTGPFFQKSFLSVINPENWSEPVVTQEEYETIADGKRNRSSAHLDDDMRRYNKLENQALSRVLGSLEEGFTSLGIHLRPNQWFGPGQAASAWLKGRAITNAELQECVPGGALEAARESYFGGWFEIMAHGIVPGTTYEYDINSAYPHVISTLPCLKHGEWRHNVARNRSGDVEYTLVRGHVSNTDSHVGAMLHRDDSGNISRPNRTEGWYWLHELQASSRALGTVWSADESWTYIPCECPPPLSDVRGIYDLRRKVGKSTPLGVACKLVPNSLYGKFAQSIGSPEYGNPVYASLITSGCRAMILDAIASHPLGTNGVLMVATDGVYFREVHPFLSLSGDLGHWEEAEKRNLCLFKPGVYWDDKAREKIRDGETPVFKARGVNARDFAGSIAIVDRQFLALSANRPSRIQWPHVEFPVSFAMVTGLQALARGRWGLAGTLIPEPTSRQSSDPSLKRSGWHWDGPLLRSKPSVNEPYEASRPYEKRFGIDDPWSDETRELGGITPDGLPGNLWKEALYD
jgi:hypothetical protein